MGISRELESEILTVRQKNLENFDSLIETACTYLDTLAKSKINLFVFVSKPGLGKSLVSEQYLKDKGKVCVIGGFITPLEFYKKLYKYREDSFIIIDDIDVLFEDKKCRGLLLQALWAATGNNRKVSYSSSDRVLDETPPEFDFKSKIVVCSNNINNELCVALISRGIYYEIKPSREMILAKMYQIAETEGIPTEIVEYIESITTLANKDLNLRDLRKAVELYQYTNWKTLVAIQLQVEYDDLILAEAIEKYDKVIDQINFYMKNTKRSASTFYRKKRNIAV